MKRSLMLAAAASFLMCGSAEAVTYSLVSPSTNIAFTFDYPSGHITTEQTITNFTANTNVDSAQFCFAGEMCGPVGSGYASAQEGIYVIGGGGETIIINGQPVIATSVGTIFYFTDGSFENNGVYLASYEISSAHNGILSVGPIGSAVPEPASWLMMIVGMGAVGYAMRRRKVTTRVQFA